METAERFFLFNGIAAHARRDSPRAFALNAGAVIVGGIPKVMAADGPDLLEVLRLMRDAVDADVLDQFEDAAHGAERMKAFATIADELARAEAVGPAQLQAVRDGFEAAGIVAPPAAS